jgi:hypothetical protein
MGDQLQDAYDTAAAVFSRSFRFVEWKFVIAAKGHSAPFGDRGEPRHKAIKRIDRAKWIYVFRHWPGEEYAAIKEEILIDAKGEMAATRSDELEREIKDRGKPVSLGKTLCLPRRILGKPQVYRFYASRVRLPLKQMKELQSTIVGFAPTNSIQATTRRSVKRRRSLPVVDPITVVLYLHAAFCGCNDVVDYTSGNDLVPGVRGSSVAERSICLRLSSSRSLARRTTRPQTTWCTSWRASRVLSKTFWRTM